MSDKKREHVNAAGEFQSDKYPWCKADFVPLKLSDPAAREVLLRYADLREPIDAAFSDDLRFCIEQQEKERPTMSDSGRTFGDAEHHAELGQERKEVNAGAQTTASELAAAKKYADATEGGVKIFQIRPKCLHCKTLVTELRRLEEREKIAQREQRALDAVLNVAEQQQASIEELEKELRTAQEIFRGTVSGMKAEKKQ